jgi:hypothetical protein
VIEAQGQDPSPALLAYLERELFGGMGSLNDFSLDGRELGPTALAATQKLHARLAQFFKELRTS